MRHNEYITTCLWTSDYLDYGVVFDAHGRVLRVHNVLPIFHTRDRGDLHSRDTTLGDERNLDREENACIVSADGELQGSRTFLGINEGNGPVERVARRVQCPFPGMGRDSGVRAVAVYPSNKH